MKEIRDCGNCGAWDEKRFSGDWKEREKRKAEVSPCEKRVREANREGKGCWHPQGSIPVVEEKPE